MDTWKQILDTIATLIHENQIVAVAVVILLFMLCCYLIQIAVMGALLAQRRLLCRLLHPSNFPKGSWWQQTADTWLLWLERTAPSKLPSGRAVRSLVRTYGRLTAIGNGDVCDVQRAESNGQLYVLKVPRTRSCDRLLAREQFVLRQLHEQGNGDTYSRYLPIPVEAFCWERQSYFAYIANPSFVPAAEIKRRFPDGLDGRHVAWMFNRILEVLGFAHQHGWVHGAVLPPHLLFDPQSHGLQLLGWLHAEPCHQPLRFGSRDFQAWYPPECRRREAATPATDIYMAARCMMWLAGGDPLSAAILSHLPLTLSGCFQSCLADSPSERPQNAWQLHEEFKTLLEGVYGPPQFCPLILT